MYVFRCRTSAWLAGVKPGNDGAEDHVNNAIRSSSLSAMSTASGSGGGGSWAAGEFADASFVDVGSE